MHPVVATTRSGAEGATMTDPAALEAAKLYASMTDQEATIHNLHGARSIARALLDTEELLASYKQASKFNGAAVNTWRERAERAESEVEQLTKRGMEVSADLIRSDRDLEDVKAMLATLRSTTNSISKAVEEIENSLLAETTKVSLETAQTIHSCLGVFRGVMRRHGLIG